MKSTQRRAVTTAGFLALSLTGSQLLAQQQPLQRGGPPNSDTPYILVTTFHGSDRQLGTQMADELRQRLQREHGAKELYVIPKTSINNTLEASGYRPDSALSASDLMELAKQLRGEQVVEGTIEKGGTGVKVDARLLMRSGQQTVAQPLGSFDAKDVGDAANKVEKAVSEAGKSIPQYKNCRNSAMAGKYPEAIASAKAGVAAYANSTLARICLLSIYAVQKAPADTIISVATAIRSLDPTSMIALANLADAYKAKGDTAKAIETNLAIYRLDPSNTTIATSIVADLAQSGAPDKALPIVDSLLVQNPGDPNMLRTKWLLLARAGRNKQALAAGDEYAKADTTAMDLEYFQRQIGIAQLDSNTAAIQLYAARAMQKFPKEVTFPTLLAQSYMKAGQMQQALAAARRATTIDPKNQNAWLYAIAAANGSNMKDSAAAFAQQAIAAGADKATFGAALLGPTQELFAKAQASKARADWEAVMTSAQAVDQLASTAQSKFFVGLASFQVAADLVNQLQEQAKAAQKSNKKGDKEAACTTAKSMEDLLATTAINMPAGASVSKETATQIMTGSTQLGDFVNQIKKAFACK